MLNDNVRLQVCCTQEIQQGKHTPDALDSMSKANLAISLRLPKDMHSPPTKCSFGKEKKKKRAVHSHLDMQWFYLEPCTGIF